MSKLLIDDHPLQVLPGLAVAIGLNEAILLQQIHYWIKKSNHHYDERTWIYNSATKWQQQFPFWSESTIRRTINSLKKQEMIVTTDKYNKLPMDKTLWYSINYDALNRVTRPSSQNDQTILSDCIDDVVKMDRAIPETTQETTTDIDDDMMKNFDNLIQKLQSEGLHFMNNSTNISKFATTFKTLGPELSEHLTTLIITKKPKHFSYIDSIVNNWKTNGIDTVEKAIAESEARQKKQTPKKDEEFDKLREMFGG